MVPLDAVGLVLADVEPALRDQLGVGRPVVRAVETGAPALHPFQQSAQGGGVTTAAFPVNHSPCSTIPSLPDPELVGLFSGSATSRPARRRRPAPRARASARTLQRTARSRPSR